MQSNSIAAKIIKTYSAILLVLIPTFLYVSRNGSASAHTLYVVAWAGLFFFGVIVALNNYRRMDLIWVALLVHLGVGTLGFLATISLDTLLKKL